MESINEGKQAMINCRRSIPKAKTFLFIISNRFYTKNSDEKYLHPVIFPITKFKLQKPIFL